MTYLLDTHLLLWAAGNSPRLPAVARQLIEDEDNELMFSAASLWEVAIKFSLGKPEFQVHPAILRHGLLVNGYVEMPIAGDHAMGVASLPDHHRDPFDRLLVVQAQLEGLTLLTTDAQVARYPGPIRLVS